MLTKMPRMSWKEKKGKSELLAAAGVARSLTKTNTNNTHEIYEA